MLKEEKVLGVKINTGLDYDKVLDYIESTLLKDGKSHLICTTNPEFIMDAQNDSEFKKIINESSLSVPDGSGVLLALEYKRRISKIKKGLLFPLIAFATGVSVGLESLLKSTSFGQTIFGVSLAEKICELSSERNYSVFFLGGKAKDFLGNDVATKDDLATQAADAIRQKYPNINIVGSTSSFSREASDDVITVAYIQDCMKKAGIQRLDFLFVAYNHKHQEKWILRSAKNIPASVSVGVGGTLDYFANIKTQSPDIVTQRNLGWLFRLFTQPWRFKRILKAFPAFPLKIFSDSIKN